MSALERLAIALQPVVEVCRRIVLATGATIITEETGEGYFFAQEAGGRLSGPFRTDDSRFSPVC